MYALIFQISVFLPLIGTSLVTDLLRRTWSSYPHREGVRRYSKLCSLRLWSFLYNSPFLNIWSYQSIIVLSVYKTLYLSAVLWLVLIFLHIPFSLSLPHPTLTAGTLPLLLGLFLISQSLVHWTVAKANKENRVRISENHN